jgi:hypothetical protein
MIHLYCWLFSAYGAEPALFLNHLSHLSFADAVLLAKVVMAASAVKPKFALTTSRVVAGFAVSGLPVGGIPVSAELVKWLDLLTVWAPLHPLSPTVPWKFHLPRSMERGYDSPMEECGRLRVRSGFTESNWLTT